MKPTSMADEADFGNYPQMLDRCKTDSDDHKNHLFEFCLTSVDYILPQMLDR